MFDLPRWFDELATPELPDPRDQVLFAVGLARRNVEADTGGPFGAAIFEIESGRLVSAGVNLVVPSRTAIAHAEIVAIARAGEATGSFDLGAEGLPVTSMATSCEPCAMCFGAVPWSGVRRLLTSARDEDARSIGFDEGPKMTDWREALESRGITVRTDVERTAGREVLEDYASGGGVIYNGRGA